MLVLTLEPHVHASFILLRSSTILSYVIAHKSYKCYLNVQIQALLCKSFLVELFISGGSVLYKLLSGKQAISHLDLNFSVEISFFLPK